MKNIGVSGGKALQGILVEHGEKVVLGVAVVLVVFLIYSGYFQEKIAANQSPEALAEAAAGLSRHINSREFSTVANERTLTLLSVDSEVFEMPDLESFQNSKSISPPLFSLATLRTDPELFPVTDLIVRAGNGPVATSGENESESVVPSADSREIGALGDESYLGFIANKSHQARGIRFAALVGLIPVGVQRDEYYRCFLNAGFDDQRDTPAYVFSQVQRREIRGNQETEWVALPRKLVERQTQMWADSKKNDPVDERYVHPPLEQRVSLTGPLAPLMNRDLTEYATHPKIVSLRNILESKNSSVSTEEPEEPGENEAPFGFNDSDAPFPVDADEEQPASEANDEPQPVNHFLFRLFDTTVLSGKTYRFRVRLIMVDPNNPPPNLFMPPDLAMLEQDVMIRVNKDNERERPVRYRVTPWSEPSEAITIPNDQMILAGNTEGGRMLRMTRELSVGPELLGTSMRGAKDDLRMKMMTVAFDLQSARDFPSERPLYRGSVANFTQNVLSLDPITRGIEEFPDRSFETGFVVLDIRSLRPVNQIVPPAEVLLLDNTGNIVVRREIDDYAEYQRFRYQGSVESSGIEEKSERSLEDLDDLPNL